MIAFIGSVFSPYYAWANAKMPAVAENHCALNMALYRKRGGYWAMTERGQKSLARDAAHLRIGPSNLHWDGTALTAVINELMAPIPKRLRGKIRLMPQAIQEQTFTLDDAGRHRWRPIAPKARVEVAFEHPKLSWSGHGYFDMNNGDVKLAEDFDTWHWLRSIGTVRTKIIYDVHRRDGSARNLALDISESGAATAFTPPPVTNLPDNSWRVARAARADDGFMPRVIKTLEDAPFYARSLVETRIGGETASYMHESLSLKRFEKTWVRLLLPFRMPRIGR